MFRQGIIIAADPIYSGFYSRIDQFNYKEQDKNADYQGHF